MTKKHGVFRKRFHQAVRLQTVPGEVENVTNCMQKLVRSPGKIPGKINKGPRVTPGNPRKLPGNSREPPGNSRETPGKVKSPKALGRTNRAGIFQLIQAITGPFTALKTLKIRKKYGTNPGEFPILPYKAL